MVAAHEMIMLCNCLLESKIREQELVKQLDSLNNYNTNNTNNSNNTNVDDKCEKDDENNGVVFVISILISFCNYRFSTVFIKLLTVCNH